MYQALPGGDAPAATRDFLLGGRFHLVMLHLWFGNDGRSAVDVFLPAVRCHAPDAAIAVVSSGHHALGEASMNAMGAGGGADGCGGGADGVGGGGGWDGGGDGGSSSGGGGGGGSVGGGGGGGGGGRGSGWDGSGGGGGGGGGSSGDYIGLVTHVAGSDNVKVGGGGAGEVALEVARDRARQGLTLVHVRAQLEHLQDAFMS